jgi:hypothetical protein
MGAVARVCYRAPTGMSGRLVSAVFASALPAWLKPYAAAYATFAADDGSRVFPARKTIAKMVGRSERRVYVATALLRASDILVLTGHGPHRSIGYSFVESALPQLGDGHQLPLFRTKSRDPQADGPKPSIKRRFPQVAQALTGSGRQAKPDAGITRSFIDPSSTLRTRARERAKAHARKAKVP